MTITRTVWTSVAAQADAEDSWGCLILAIAVVLLLSGGIGAVCWPYTINTWLAYCGKEPVIVWWQGALIGFAPVLGQFSIPCAVVTWILMLFLGGA